MNYIQPSNRYQVSFGSLDEQIEPDNAVRFIEAFVGYYHQSDPGIIIQSDPPKLSTRLIA
jgi:hypothetical protein